MGDYYVSIHGLCFDTSEALGGMTPSLNRTMPKSTNKHWSPIMGSLYTMATATGSIMSPRAIASMQYGTDDESD
jgi:hypothetical protein